MSRPPWTAVVIFLVAAAGAGWWMMAHTYDVQDPGVCGARYAAARTADDSAAVDRTVPDSELRTTQRRSCGVLRGPTPSEFAADDSLLSRAIAATGGDSALSTLRAMTWEVTATVATPDGTASRAEEWRLAPPDTAVIRTGAHREVYLGTTAWGEAPGDTAPIPADRAADQRRLLQVISLLRLVTLREPGVVCLPLPPDPSGHPGLLVRVPSRLDTAVYFGDDGRVAAVRIRAAPAPGAPLAEEVFALEGEFAIGGIHWFRTMRITRDGNPVLELELTTARAEPTSAASWIDEAPTSPAPTPRP